LHVFSLFSEKFLSVSSQKAFFTGLNQRLCNMYANKGFRVFKKPDFSKKSGFSENFMPKKFMEPYL